MSSIRVTAHWRHCSLRQYALLKRVWRLLSIFSKNLLLHSFLEFSKHRLPIKYYYHFLQLTWQNTNFPYKHTCTVYPKKYAHGFCFAVICCGYTLTDFPISIRLTSLALWQSNDCPSASKATLMNMNKYFMWIHYERLHNHNKAKHNKIVCIFLGIYCMSGKVNVII